VHQCVRRPHKARVALDGAKRSLLDGAQGHGRWTKKNKRKGTNEEACGQKKQSLRLCPLAGVLSTAATVFLFLFVSFFKRRSDVQKYFFAPRGTRPRMKSGFASRP